MNGITIIEKGNIERKTERGRPKTPFMKKIIKNIERTTYKELKVAMIDRDKY